MCIIEGENVSSYPNYFLEAQLFLSNIAELCSSHPEHSSISLDIETGSSRIIDLFSIAHNKATVPVGIHLQENGIGISDGSLVYCPSWAMTLTNSYLRFSGIIIHDSVLNDISDITPIHVVGPGIIIARNGASFYVDKEEWSYISESDTVVIQPNQRDSEKQLLLLISWLKSNIFAWDLLWNKHRQSAFYKSIEDSLYIPNLNDVQLDMLCSLTRTLLQCEAKFVSDYNCSELDGEFRDSDEDIDKFNTEVLSILRKLEKIFEEYYHVPDKEKEIISHELKLKGYFSYSE